MRENNGVCVRVRQIKGAAEDVAKFVVQGHLYGAETGTAEPGPILGFLPRGLGFRVSHDLGQRFCERFDPL